MFWLVLSPSLCKGSVIPLETCGSLSQSCCEIIFNALRIKWDLHDCMDITGLLGFHVDPNSSETEFWTPFIAFIWWADNVRSLDLLLESFMIEIWRWRKEDFSFSLSNVGLLVVNSQKCSSLAQGFHVAHNILKIFFTLNTTFLRISEINYLW